jgi:cytochrome bd-type quinol oxidase subunit 2
MNIASGMGQRSSTHAAHRFHFFRHLSEMALAMMVGMIASAALFLSAVGMTADEALRRHAVLFVVVQAFGMTVVMVAWMRHRGHVWRSCLEMAVAMVLPAVPLICLRLLDVISGPICSVYCVSTVVAMVVVMLYRRSDYRGVGAVVPAR